MWEIWRSQYKRWFWLGGLVLLIAVLPRSGQANSGAVISHKLIAVYLYNFTNYIDWPESRSVSQVCIYGDGPVEAALRYIADQQKTITVKAVSDVSQMGACHILFIGDERTMADARAAAKSAEPKPILTVSEHRGFVGQGGMIEFVYGDDALKISIHKTRLEQAGLKANSKLMSLAEVVE